MRFALSILFLSLTACGTVTIDTQYSPSRDNTYDEYFDGWLMGFAGEGRADLKGACPGDRIARIKVGFSLEDILLGGITQGIYAPHSAKIFCSQENKSAQNP